MQHAETKIFCLRVLHFGELGVYISEGKNKKRKCSLYDGSLTKLSSIYNLIKEVMPMNVSV